MRRFTSISLSAPLLAVGWALVFVPARPNPRTTQHPRTVAKLLPPSSTPAKPVVTRGKALPETPFRNLHINFPRELTQRDFAGYVRIRLLISTEGVPTNVEPIRATVHPSLIQPALEIVRNWRYQPTLIDGQPVEVQSEMDFRFHP